MIEYIYDAIKASAGQPIGITAKITKEDSEEITKDCNLILYDDEKMLIRVDGVYLGNSIWQFEVPAETTQDLKGRYWYSISHEDSDLCFKQPLYLV